MQLQEMQQTNGTGIVHLPYRPDALNPEVLEAHLLRRLTTRIRELSIVLMADGLILRGRVRTYYDKQLAQHALMEATTLPILSNEIEVESTS